MYLSNSKRQIYIRIIIEEKINRRITLCMTLHIKRDKKFKNTNLETKGDRAKIRCVKLVPDSCTHRSNNTQKNCCNYRKKFDEICLKNMYLQINDRGGYSENSQRSNFNYNKKSTTVTMMTIDLQMFMVSLLERQMCVFITIKTNIHHYRKKQSFTS